MTHRIALTIAALTASLVLAAAAHAQSGYHFKTVEVAMEALAGKVTLPSGPGSALVAIPCQGCAPKSFRATRATTYFLGKQQVTLGELAAAVSSQPMTPLTVLYSFKTGELTRITADLPPAASRR
jgi:hypothetical protein